MNVHKHDAEKIFGSHKHLIEALVAGDEVSVWDEDEKAFVDNKVCLSKPADKHRIIRRKDNQLRF